MDSRLIILAVSFALLVVSLLSLVVQMIRARRHRTMPNFEPIQDWPMLKPAPPEIVAASGPDLFAESRSGVSAVLNEPLRAGEWKPSSGQQSNLPRTSQVDDYWDSLIAEDSLLVHPVSSAPRAPSVTELWPDSIKPTLVESVPSVDSEPELEPEVQPEPEPELIPVVDAVAVAEAPVESERIAEIVAELEQDSPVLEEELSQPATPIPEEAEPDVAAVIAAPVISHVEPASVPTTAAPLPVVEPPSPAPMPDPVIAPASIPAPMPDPVTAAPEPEPLIAPPTPAPVTATPTAAPVTATPTPAPVIAAPPPVPVPAVAIARPKAVATAEPVPPAAVEPRPIAAQPDRSEVRARPSAMVVQSNSDSVPEHELVAPVEMWFGEYRIGVKAGSRTYERFQKIANVLFEDFKQATSSR